METKTARIAALETLQRVEVEGYKADATLNRFLCSLRGGDREKALARELCYGVLRWRLKLDHVLSQFYNGDLEKLTPWIRNILRLGVYQLLFLHRVPPWAALNESVKLAHRYGHKGTAGLVNGILRSVSKERDQIAYPALSESALAHIAVQYSHPRWLVKRWIERYGVEGTISICKANNEIPPLTVRANTLRISPLSLTEALRNQGLRVAPCKYAQIGLKIHGCGAPTELEAFQTGLLQVQDEASMLATRLLNPGEGMKVLDCCAGLGGKATLTAEMMHDRGSVAALDINRHRLSLSRENSQRLGIHIIQQAVMDSSVPLGLSASFDAVIVDAPCSDLGVLRRHPEIKWKRKEEDLLRFQRLQLQIMGNVCRYVKPTGVILYSTCTVEPEEDQEVIRAFLSSNPEFSLEDARPFLPPQAQKFVTPEGFFFTFPHTEDMDGFFAARIRRNRRGS